MIPDSATIDVTTSFLDGQKIDPSVSFYIIAPPYSSEQFIKETFKKRNKN